MKRETAVAWYFWTMVAMSVVYACVGKSVECVILFAAAGIVGALNVIARDYFDGR